MGVEQRAYSREQLKALFNAALEVPPAERAAFLDRACSNAALRRDLDVLLAAHDDAGTFLERPAIAAVDGTTEHRSTLASGSRLGPYEIVDLLGAGGMGEVYRARDERIGRQVAVKVLPVSVAADRDRARRFEQEARAAGSLNHPNILTIHDVGTARHGDIESPYLVTELLDGVTLREKLRSLRSAATPGPCEPLDVTTAIDYAGQMARGLIAAHAAGVVHRDLKPENLFITRDGTVKILDFGLAKLAPTAAFLEQTETGTGIILGTVGYMAPEQIRGQAIDHRADLFAFGTVVYEMLSGCRAFERASGIDTLGAILNAEPEPLPPTVPPALASLVRQCLEKDAARRPSSAAEVAAALQAIREGHAALAALPVGAQQRRRATPAILAIAAIAVAALAALGVWRWRTDRGPASSAAEARRVVAVLPFRSIASDASQEYFASGMTEEIMSQLSRLSSLRVMSRPAIARYTGPGGNLRRIGPELGVGSLVTGSVRLAGSRARIDVQLVDARNEESLWSEQYDGDLKDIFAVQGDVARRIAAALQATLSAAEAAHLDKPPTTNAEAYQLYLRARALGTVTQERNHQAIDLLREAIRLDPSFADGHAALAIRLGWLGDFGDRPRYAEAKAEAQEAVRLDPSLGRAHYSLASIHARTGHVEDARLSFLRAVEFDPNSNAAFADLSVAESTVGHFDQALHWARRMFALAPNVAYAYYHIGIPLILLAANDPAERWLLDAERRMPTYQRVQGLIATLDFLRGDEEAALGRVRRSVASQPDNQEGQNLLPEFALMAGAPDAASLIEGRFKTAPEARTMGMLPETFRLLRAFTLIKAGDSAAARPLLDASLALSRREIAGGSEFPEERMEIAAVHALRGERDDAIHWLEEAYRAGWRLYRETGRDPLFASLRMDPAFRDLLQRMERDVTAMRERAHPDDLPTMPPASAESSR